MACDTTQSYRGPRVKAAFERMVQDLLKHKETNCHAPTEWTDPRLNRGERRPGKVVPFIPGISGRRESRQTPILEGPVFPPKNRASVDSSRPRPAKKRGMR